MSVDDLLIHFKYSDDDIERPQRQYYMPGDELMGIVSLNLKSSIKIMDFKIHFQGKATVSWESLHKNRTYVATETYLDTSKPLLDIGYDDTVTLPSGLHQFAFKYLLPTDLPSTFNGIYGGVTFVAKAKLECEDERLTTVTSEPFMILRRPELPIDIYQPNTMKKSKYFWGFSSGKISVECSIDKSAAVPGDYISIDADVSNMSGKEISLIQAAMIMESRYYAEGKDIIFRQYLNTRDDFFDTADRRGRRWHHVLLQVPPYLADSGLDTCNIMDLRYIFQFKVKVVGKDDILLETPLYVGLHSGEMGPEGKDLLLGRMWQGMSNFQEDNENAPPAYEYPWYGNDPALRGGVKEEFTRQSYNGSVLRA